MKYLNKNIPILITGEAGTGKSTLAREIHTQSYNSNSTFKTIHLATIKESLFESEIFGHKKGSFSGAHKDHIGYCESVGRGTLFLDEIGELSLALQKKLLYLLEERLFTPVGSCNERRFQGRFIFATNKDLEDLVEKGLFREDLYYRITVLEIYQKPIKSSQELITKALDKFLKDEGHLQLSEACREVLLNYNWPGNYRELRNVILYAGLRCEHEVIELKDLPQRLQLVSTDRESAHLDYYRSFELFDRAFLTRALKAYSGRINKTSREIGISKTTLIAKMRKYGMTNLI